jgi:hypothetical protein
MVVTGAYRIQDQWQVGTTKPRLVQTDDPHDVVGDGDDHRGLQRVNVTLRHVVAL